MRFLDSLLMTLGVALGPGIAAQEAPPIRSAAAAGKVDPQTRVAAVRADGTALTLTLQVLLERAPNLRELKVLHPSSTTLEIGTLEALAGFAQLERLTLSGDPFLYDDEFAALGRLSHLRSLRLALP